MTYVTAKTASICMKRVATRVLAAIALVVALGCTTDDGDPNGEGGAGRDGAMPDPAGAGGEGGAGGSAGGGSGGSAGPDSGLDGGGGEEDAGHEPDAGTGHTGLWQGCPDAEDFGGADDGPHTLTASAASVYCAMFEESRTLKEELEAKAMLRVAEGSYGLPGADASDFALPICVRSSAAPHAVLQTPGSVTYTSQAGSGTTTHIYNYRQPFALGSGTRTLDTRLELVTGAGETPGIVLDGENVPAFDETSDRVSFTLCEDPDNCYPARIFDSCTFENATVQVHTVDLGEDGQVELEVHIGESFASTEPGAFVRATGSYRGQSFDQRDYFRLVYSPDHHHFARDFAVLFDTPIDGACGIEIARLEPFEPESEPNEAYAIDCELDRIETLSVTAHAFDNGN